MKYQRRFLFLVLGFAMSVPSQGSGSAPAESPSSTPQAQASSQMAQQMQHQMAPPLHTIAEVVDLQVTQMERQVMGLAEAMPEDKFDFNPTNLNLADSRDPVRTFAGQLKHLATDNYAIWSPMTGDPMPPGIRGVEGPEDIKTKADVIRFVKGSFALGHKAAATLTAENAMELLLFRGMKVPRAYLATFALVHSSDHCGQLAIYLRLAGITPPGSRK